jgi:uncharacterized protein
MAEALIVDMMFLKMSTMNNTLELSMACLDGDIEKVKTIVSSLNGDLNNQIELDGTTPLMLACYTENLEIVLYLLNHGADINYKKQNGKTALHIAAYYGFKSVVKILFKYGAKYDNSNDYTPLLIASYYLHEDCVDCIKDLYVNDITNQDLINSSEILACTYLDSNGCLEKSLTWYKKSYELRNLFQISKVDIISKENDQFCNISETNCFDQIEIIINEAKITTNFKYCYIEAILTKRRILGRNHYITLMSCYFTILYFDFIHHEFAIKLIIFLLHPKTLPRNKSINILSRLIIILAKLSSGILKNDTIYDDFENDLTKLFNILSFCIISIPKDLLNKSDIQTLESISKIISSYIYFVEIFLKIKNIISVDNQLIISNNISNVLNANPTCGIIEHNLLQIACSSKFEKLMRKSYSFTYISEFPSLSLIDYIYKKCNDSILYYKDKDGNNLLFYALEHSEPYGLCKLLINNGYHPDILNNLGKTVIDYVKLSDNNELKELFMPFEFNLSCICARKLKSINYDINNACIKLPKTLRDFVNNH